MFFTIFLSSVKSQISRWNRAKEQKDCSLFHLTAVHGMASVSAIWLSKLPNVCLLLMQPLPSCVAFEAKRLFSFTFIRVNNDGSSETTNRDFYLSPISHFHVVSNKLYWLDLCGFTSFAELQRMETLVYEVIIARWCINIVSRRRIF